MRLADPVDLLSQASSIPGQVPQFADRRRWHKARSQQPVLQQVGDPLAILLIRLPPRHRFDMLRVHQQHLKLPFQKIPNWFPIHPGGLHGHMGYSAAAQPVAQLQKFLGERAELPRLMPSARGPHHTGRHALLMHIQTTTNLVHDLHRHPPSASRRTSANYRDSLACSPLPSRRQPFVVPIDVQVIFVLGLGSRQNSSSFVHMAQPQHYPHLEYIFVVRRTMNYS